MRRDENAKQTQLPRLNIESWIMNDGWAVVAKGKKTKLDRFASFRFAALVEY